MRWLISLALLLGCHGVVEATPDRIATFNVLKLERGEAEIVEILRELDADILGLQEIPGKQAAKRIANALDLHHVYEVRWRGNGGTVGVALLAKEPITDPKPLLDPIDDTAFGLRARVADTHVAVVHLQPSFPLTPEALAAAAAARQRQAEVIVRDHADAGLPGRAIVMSDFNHLPTANAYDYLDETFADAGADAGPTFRIGLVRTRIDYVWLGSAFTAISAKVLPTAASDHDPLIIILD
ncbi:MAG: endonuclease/exonuclease/phosphatase family protein [Planctomycetota bacterium]